MKAALLGAEVRIRRLLHLRPRIRRIRVGGRTVYVPTHYDWMPK